MYMCNKLCFLYTNKMLRLIVCTIPILMIFNNGTIYNNVLPMYEYIFIIYMLSCASTKIKYQAINCNIMIAKSITSNCNCTHNHTALHIIT